MTRAQIPMLLTYARIAAIPAMVVLWSIPVPHAPWWVLGLFAFASLTDFLDGWLARRWHVTSALGAMLDQIADKLLVATVLIMLTYDHHIPAALAIVLLLRELLVSGLREFAGLRAIPLPVSKGGKWKTALQMIGLTLALYAIGREHVGLLVTSHALLAISAVLSWWSAAGYMRAAMR
ncbi:MAG: CDP-diacylglycerol--glycerol-3-phosphate 3-phosphatidyltransferase [Alphaproteobacteria bacterium]|nr:CDP-diacylglycerol--glycerol-3-phosphate 3-phosphatidyltransferase [Alphaproteobacteria bacterium]